MLKIPLLILPAFLLFSSCNLGLDEKNLVGGDLARAKLSPRPVHSVTVNFAPALGLDSSRSTLAPVLWGKSGPCRFGVHSGYPILAYVELTATGVPSDFDSLYNPHPRLPSEPTGIDSIRLVLHFKTGSSLSRDTLRPQILLYKARKKTVILPTGTTYLLDTASLESLHVITDILPAPLDSSLHVVTLKPGTNLLFRHLDSLLCRRDGDTALFSLALGLLGSPTGNTLFTLDPARPPQIRFYGKRRQIFGVDNSLYHNDTLIADSVSTSLSLLGTSALPASVALFQNGPAMSTLFIQPPVLTDPNAQPAGYYQAELFLNKNSLFTGLTRDSLTILGARAVFFPDPDSSWSEDRTAIRLLLRCRFYDRDGKVVTLTHSLFSASDTLVNGFSPGFDTTLVYPIDKYVAALTDPRFAEVATLGFRVAPYHNGPADTDVNIMSRTAFLKKMRITFTHTPR